MELAAVAAQEAIKRFSKREHDRRECRCHLRHRQRAERLDREKCGDPGTTVVDGGGPRIKPVHVSLVFWGSAWTREQSKQDALKNAVTKILSGSFMSALAQYGALVGLAFQIADDVLDVTATTDQLGKTAGRDLELRKSTYPALLGVEGANARARALIEDGCRTLAAVDLLTPALAQIARFTIERTS